MAAPSLCARHDAGGRSPDDPAGYGRPPGGDGSAGHDRPASPVPADAAARGPADGPGGEALRGSPAGATDAPGAAAGHGPSDDGGTPDGPAASPGAPENAQSFQPGNGKRLVAGHGAPRPGSRSPRSCGRARRRGRPHRPLPRSLTRQPVPQPAPAQPTYTAQPAAASHAAPPVQPRLSGLDPKDRLATSRAEEDLLDIPAFLRRQAN